MPDNQTVPCAVVILKVDKLQINSAFSVNELEIQFEDDQPYIHFIGEHGEQNCVPKKQILFIQEIK